MRIPRVYLPEAASGQELILPQEATHRLIKVLRLEPGHPLTVFNGNGDEYPAELTGTPNHPAVKLGKLREVDRESPLTTVLWAGLSKAEKFDWTVQKATELGVTEIRPVQTNRSVRRLDSEKATKNRRRWLRIAISACEQCGRNRLPRIGKLEELDTSLSEGVTEGLVMAASGQSLPDRVESQPLHLLIGPEGGLSEEELTQAIAAGFSPTALGPRTLRTETAVLTALAWAQTVSGDLPLGAG